MPQFAKPLIADLLDESVCEVVSDPRQSLDRVYEGGWHDSEGNCNEKPPLEASQSSNTAWNWRLKRLLDEGIDVRFDRGESPDRHPEGVPVSKKLDPLMVVELIGHVASLGSANALLSNAAESSSTIRHGGAG